jgi:hypothetical protein
MKKILLVLFLFFVGCNNKIGVLQKDARYNTLMQYTKRGEIVKSFETIAIINATYMNPVLENNETKNNEIFIIGVYNSDDYKGYEKGGINNPNFTLTMNDMNYTKATKADLVKLNIKDYPFYTKWMKYYKVYFPKSNGKLNIKYTNKLQNASVVLSIPKQIYITN